MGDTLAMTSGRIKGQLAPLVESFCVWNRSIYYGHRSTPPSLYSLALAALRRTATYRGRHAQALNLSVPVDNSRVTLLRHRSVPLDHGHGRVARHVDAVGVDAIRAHFEQLPRLHVAEEPLGHRDEIGSAGGVAVAEIRGRVRRVGADHEACVNGPFGPRSLALPQEGAAAVVAPIRSECLRPAV